MLFGRVDLHAQHAFHGDQAFYRIPSRAVERGAPISEELDNYRKEGRETVDGASDAAKDAMTAPIKPVGLIGKCIKWITKKIWKETDPGEE